MPSKVLITIEFDPTKRPTAFTEVQRLIKVLLDANDEVAVSLTETAPAIANVTTNTDPPPTSKPPPRRGRPPGKSANGGQPAATVSPASEDVSGGDLPEDEDDDPGLTQPTMTGLEAAELARGGARLVFAAGHKGDVAEVRKQLGVAKWDDIPPSDGHRALKLVRELAEKHGIRV